MGRNEISVFICNESRWGCMGRNRLSPLEMGSKGGGRVSQSPQVKEIGRRVDGKPQPELGNGEIGGEEKQGRNTPHGGCATRVWFTKERLLVPHESSQARAPAVHKDFRSTSLIVLHKRKSEVAVNRLRDTVRGTPFVLR